MTNLVKLRVRFLTTPEGGRNSAIITEGYRFPVRIADEYFDCRLVSAEQPVIPLGIDAEICVAFLNYDKVRARLECGMKLEIWEGRKIGYSEVLELG